PFRGAVIAGGVLIVLGGFALVGERDRPEHFRLVGAAAAFGPATLFATRGVIVRCAAGETHVAPGRAAGRALGGGAGRAAPAASSSSPAGRSSACSAERGRLPGAVARSYRRTKPVASAGERWTRLTAFR